VLAPVSPRVRVANIPSLSRPFSTDLLLAVDGLAEVTGCFRSKVGQVMRFMLKSVLSTFLFTLCLEL